MVKIHGKPADLFGGDVQLHNEVLDPASGKRRKRDAGCTEHPRYLVPHHARREVVERLLYFSTAHFAAMSSRTLWKTTAQQNTKAGGKIEGVVNDMQKQSGDVEK